MFIKLSINKSIPSSHSVENLFSSLLLCPDKTTEKMSITILLVLCMRETWSAILTEKIN
jgi:hypothetical protein